MAKWALAPFLLGLAAAGSALTGLAGAAAGYAELAFLLGTALSSIILIFGLAFGRKVLRARPKATVIAWPVSPQMWRGRGGILQAR